MITNESELRIALQAVLVTILALSGDWACALFVAFMMLPWKPLYKVGCYLAQPIVDWRFRRAPQRQGQGIAQIERELDVLLRDVKVPVSEVQRSKPGKTPKTPGFDPLKALNPNVATLIPVTDAAQSPDQLAAILAIPPVIQKHIRNLPQGAFQNMDLEVDEVRFHGDFADACVSFKSSTVSGLVIRQSYQLRRSGDHWEVESHQPGNGASHLAPVDQFIGIPEMRPS